MSIHRVLGIAVLALLGAASLPACASDGEAVGAALTPGPAPPARPGANVWVCGSPDLVIGSADGGHTWQVRHRDASVGLLEGTLWSIAFGDLSHGWAVARGDSRSQARVLATTDGGKTWTSHYPGVKGGWLVSVAATDARHVWAVGHQGSFALGRGLVLASSDGGETWRRQPLPTGLVPKAVAFADARRGWAVAVEDAVDASPPFRYSVLSTSDGGAHWRTSHTAAEGEILNSLAAIGPDHCWAVGYAEEQHAGLVVRTTDGGLHWSAQRPAPRQSLKDVSFPDAQDGWAVGHGGTVLVTHDGGATWAPQSSGVRSDLSQVSFSDTQHGWALDAVRALLATGDGGKSWSVVKPEGSGDLMLGLTAFDSGVGDR